MSTAAAKAIPIPKTGTGLCGAGVVWRGNTVGFTTGWDKAAGSASGAGVGTDPV